MIDAPAPIRRLWCLQFGAADRTEVHLIGVFLFQILNGGSNLIRFHVNERLCIALVHHMRMTFVHFRAACGAYAGLFGVFLFHIVNNRFNLLFILLDRLISD